MLVDLGNVANAPLKILFGVHFFLSVWGIQGSWSPDSYFFYNLLFFLTLLWAIHCKDSVEAVEMAMFIAISSVILDIIVITVCFPTEHASDRFSVGMAILNLLVRPVTTMLLYRVHVDRSGAPCAFSNNLNGLFGAGGERAPYEDIDSVHQIVPGVHAARSGSPGAFPTGFAPGGVESKVPPPYHG